MVNTVPSDYVTGTITLTNGSAAFTGTGTGWLAMMFRQGDLILDLPDAPQYVAIIDEVTSNTAGVLTRPWLGPTLTGAYRMRYQWDAGRVTAMSAFLREELGNGNLQAFAALVGSAGGVPVFIGPGAMEVRPASDFVNGVSYDVQVDTLADRAAFDGQSEGFAVLVSNVGDGRSALYSKASNAVGDWTDPAYITGPEGGTPDIAAGTTTTVPPGTPADVEIVPDGSGGYLVNFDIPSGEGFISRGAYSGATTYNKGDVVQNNGSSWVAKIATTGNAPPVLPTTSNTWWELLARAGVDGTGAVSSVVQGDGINVNSVDAANPVVSLDTAPAVRSYLGGIPFINKAASMERVLVGGLIQNSDSAGWQFVADATHESAGFDIGVISTTSTYIRVTYEFTGSQVRTLLVTPDDAYSMRGLTVGASVGLGTADIYLGLPLVGGVQINGVGGNSFFGDPAVVEGLSIVNNAAGRVTVGHGPIFDPLVQPVLGNLRGGWDGTSAIGDFPSAGILESGGTGTGNQFDVQNSSPIHARVRWVSGTTFAVDTDQAGTFTATWDAANNKLVVVHPRSQSLYDLATQTLGNKLFLSAITQTGFEMQFQNSAGSILTTPDAFFSFLFTRTGGFLRSSTFPNRYFSFSRGYVRVNPNKVYGGGGGLLLWGLIKG